MARKAHFTPELFKFFRDLGAHNERAWFAENKFRYEAHVKGPLLQFISDFAPLLRKISPHFVADPRPNGGSMFRIYRDTRFSKDKSPYKTWGAVSFGHEAAGDVHAPGFYMHVAPKESYAGAGLWHPEPPELQKIRGAIAAAPAAWKRAVKGVELDGESLKRPPQGFAPDHPLIEDLKRKDFIAGATYAEKDVVAPGFIERCAESFRDTAPLVKFLCGAIRLPY
jgi:uncharacterized protein (TIGR02453 family)